MKTIQAVVIMMIGLGGAACSNIDPVSRNAPFETLPSDIGPDLNNFSIVANPDNMNFVGPVSELNPDNTSVAVKFGQAPVHVNNVAIRVSRNLKVNEANSYYPKGDIVWRGDPVGDRHAQVQKIFEDAISRGVTSLDGPVGVDLLIDVKRFHAISEKARYTVGGVHNLVFDLAVKDTETGNLIAPVRTISADLEALGGKQALAADARGETQRVRIERYLEQVINQELTAPGGFKNAKLGLFQVVNNF